MRALFVGLCCVGAFSIAVAVQKQPEAKPLGFVPNETVSAVGDGTPRYWKGNLHTHTLWSDGDDFPEMIADWYKRHDYNFLALTEHNTFATGDRWIDAEANDIRKGAVERYQNRFGKDWVELRDVEGKSQVRLKPQSEYRRLMDDAGKFQMIPGEEITHRYARRPVHMNAINVCDTIQPIDGGSVAETITVNLRQIAEQRKKSGQQMLGFLNHPNFQYGVSASDMIDAEDLRFFEVFNGHPTVHNEGDEEHLSTEQIWDELLADRLGKRGLPLVYGLGTDDSHRYHQWGVGNVNPGRGWVMVRAKYLTPEAIVTAMEAGDFYASSGVTLKSITATDKVLSLTIEPEAGIQYTTEFIVTKKSMNPIGEVVSTSKELNPSYTFTGDELYVRAKVTSTKPHPNPYKAGDMELAWIQPVQVNTK